MLTQSERYAVSRERLNVVVEQTDFLLGKQKELYKFIEKVYTDILNLLASKISEQNDQDILNDLEALNKKISDHYNDISSDIKEDISFLEEQVNAIVQVKDVADDAKAEELLNMIISKDDVLVEMDKFKQQVEQDLGNSMRELEHMSEDLINAISEGKVKDLRLMLEAVESHEKDLEDNSSQECDVSSCSSCSGCQSEDSSDKDADLFEFFKDTEKEDK